MTFLSSYQRARLLLILASIVCFAVTWQASLLFRIPIHPGFEASLLQQPAPLLVLLLIAALLTLSTAIATLLVGRIRYNAGLAAAALGLSALSFRGGTTRHVIFWGLAHTGSPALFRTLFLETVLLAILFAALGWMLDRLYARGILKDRESHLPLGPAPSFLTHAPTLAIQALVTAAAILLLASTEAKLQVLAAVAIASFAGSATAESFFPIGRRNFACLVPLIVGAIGYALAYYNPAGATTGHLTATFAPLARPLPLDYAAAGTAGALLGSWTARRWAAERQQQSPYPQTTTP